MSNLREAAQQAIESLKAAPLSWRAPAVIEALEAALAQPDDKAQPVELEGWKMVPVAPTEAMLSAMAECDGYLPGDRDRPGLVQWEDYWIMAIAAAPQPPAEQPFQPDWVNYRQGFADGKAEAEQGAELVLPKPDCPNIWGGAYSEKQVREIVAADRKARGGAA